MYEQTTLTAPQAPASRYYEIDETTAAPVTETTREIADILCTSFLWFILRGLVRNRNGESRKSFLCPKLLPGTYRT